MRNIAIFCDGTWQKIGQGAPTNVVKLARAVRVLAEDGRPQLTYYDNGVGVGEGVMNRATRWIGGAFGAGLDHKILEAYLFLALNYMPGDRIFIFGFSRGAYTARSLSGLLRRVWILRREHADKVEEAVKIYREAPAKDAPPAVKAAAAQRQISFNQTFGHPVSAFVGAHAYDPGDARSLDAPAPEECAWVQYVGVWDTVGSMGVPSKLPFAPDFNKRYRWHDTDLSRFVRSARHAVALDEERRTFEPSLWNNLPGLNGNAQAAARPYDEQPYQQRWFPGGHGSVGGGDSDEGLSNAALLWIAEGAARAGLALDADQLAVFEAGCDPLCDFPPKKGGVLDVMGKGPREGLGAPDEISLSARRRWKGRQDWRPKPLGPHKEALEGWKDEPPAAWYRPS